MPNGTRIHLDSLQQSLALFCANLGVDAAAAAAAVAARRPQGVAHLLEAQKLARGPSRHTKAAAELLEARQAEAERLGGGLDGRFIVLFVS